MKPSERISQLLQPLIEYAEKSTRQGISEMEGRQITDEEWGEFRKVAFNPESPEFAQLQVNALVAAVIQYLDEQAEKDQPSGV